MHVGFIVTSPYQLFHFEKIAKHVANKTIYIEVRDQEFGLSNSVIKKHISGADISWVKSKELRSIDGKCDVLVCHTPVPLMRFYTKSLTVAQQYSLAKEKYQYGIWRSQASLNLMYGDYSHRLASSFSNSIAVGNPLLDNAFSAGVLPEAPSAAPSRPRALYMPTYGDLSDKETVIERLRSQNVDITIKAHHADRSTAEIAQRYNLPIYFSSTDPIKLIQEHDLIVSDYSGAIFDALAVRKPVVVVGGLNQESKDINRLSPREQTISDSCPLPGTWMLDQPFHDAYAYSRQKLSDNQLYREFLDTYFVNLGSAGEACSREITRLAEEGEPYNFGAIQVREAQRSYVEKNRRLKTKKKVTHKRGQVSRRQALRVYPPSVLALKSIRWLLDRLPGGDHVLQVLRKIRGTWHHDGANSGTKEVRRLAPSTEAAKQPQKSLSVVPHRRRRETLELLQQELRKQNVDYRCALTESKAYCAVLESDLDGLTQALKSLGRATQYGRMRTWLGRGTTYDKTRNADALQLADVASSDSIVVGIPYRNEGYSFSRLGGAEILILERRDTRLVARRWRAEKVDWTSTFKSPATTEEVGTTGPKNGYPALHALESEPIDIVYTWVDSTDKKWQATKVDWANKENIELDASDNAERFANRDELRYSLRSLWLYAPFVRNIFIVTAGHSPDWLNTAHEKIHLVSHEDIFPDNTLPTFNSHAIEACLSRIPGLAEHFIYFNDDVFLGRETKVETFYTRAGLIKSRFSPSSFVATAEPDLTAIPTDWASYNAVRLIERDFLMQFDRKMKHVPMPMKRCLLEEIETRYPDQVAKTRASRFRSRSDLSLPSMLAHYYGIATKQAVESENVPGEYVYADTGRSDFRSKLQLISRKKPTFFCLNVTRHTDIALDRQKMLLEDFLRKRFPIPSEFEMKNY